MPTTNAPIDLLINDVTIPTGSQIALINAANINLIRAYAQFGRLDVFDTSFRALNVIEGTRIPSEVIVRRDVFPATDPGYTVIGMLAPKGRAFARGLLWRAFLALQPNGKMYLSGSNDEGIKALATDLETLFGRVVTVANRGHARLLVAVKRTETPIPFPAAWGDDPTVPRLRSFSDTVLSNDTMVDVPVYTMPGVFSWEHLDAGTAMLLRTCDFRPGASLLDLGSGCGVVGAVANRAGSHVTAVDDHLLAVACTELTLRHSAPDFNSTYPSDLFESIDDLKFDHIVCNPPFHEKFADARAWTPRMLQGAKSHLNAHGRLTVVGNLFLGYDKLLKETFADTEVLAQDGSFMVVESRL